MAQQAAKDRANSLMPSMVKGKQKEENMEQKIRIGLWRASSGRHVWDVDVVGSALLAMAWSLDGLYLSVIIRVPYSDPPEEAGLKLLHLSVQDGSLAYAVPLGIESNRIVDISQLDIEWCESTAQWPQDAKGSAGMIIDSIPQPNDVEHFEVPERNNPMMAYNKKKVAVKNSNESHPLLRSFPSLLDSQPPHVLCIPVLSLSFLSGTFPLTAHRSLPFQHKGFTAKLENPILREDMLLAKSGTRLRRYCNTIMKGLESCWHVWRKGIMEELTERLDDLESCAADNGTSRDAAMADLLRLLIAGRCGDAVGQFMGGKLTDGVLAKWMSAYDDSVEYIHKTLSYSVFPAIERLLLLLEELKGWSIKRAYDLDLETSIVDECIDWARYLAIRVMDMARDVNSEAETFREFGKWLKYEISRATMQDPEDLAETSTPKHDVASVASYLDMLTDKASTLPSYFLIDSERLMGKWAVPKLPAEDDRHRPLSVVLKELMLSLRETSENSSDLDIQLSDTIDNTMLPSQGRNDVKDDTFVPQSGLNASVDAGSPADGYHVTPKEPGQDPLWSIMDVLLNKVEKLISSAIRDRTATKEMEADSTNRKTDKFHACRTAENGFTYEIVQLGHDQQVIHVRASSSEVSTFYVRAFKIDENMRVLNFDFFDDDHFVMVLQVTEGQSDPGTIYLAMISLLELQLMEGQMYKVDNLSDWPTVAKNDDQDSMPHLPVTQSRRIAALRSNSASVTSAYLALNGRKGRRFACVGVQHIDTHAAGEEPVGTRHVMIFDMDENEGIDEAVGEESEQLGDQSGVQEDHHSGYSMEVDV
ncbi:hypothetical protein QFC19_002601 [Naganishia cerealis]|uniref:Uncharacterized protein n=1 Tax=Naganishia cerealis TaxID=610337 RepID=A0ACC2WAE0_9TREE|nr:hypothetical protein QFC19_002601 [Naganishia cerealis]